MIDRWQRKDLSGQVAVVSGASRGVGRGMAEVLAECGAFVYLLGRSLDEPSAPDVTGTLADVQANIDAAGGTAVAVRCNVAKPADIAALFARVREEHGHLEILVNNAVGWSDVGADHDLDAQPWLMQPPWKAPPGWWDANFRVGVESHYAMTNAAAPLLTAGRRGLVAFTSERQPAEPGLQEFVLDLRAAAVARMAMLYSLHLRPHGVASVMLYPGFTRTETIQRAFARRDNYFEGWTQSEFEDRTASIHYAGRALASMCADLDLLELSGLVITAHDAAIRYDFTDTNGHQPDPA